VINGMMFIRGTPKDYDKWVASGNTEWSYDKVKSVHDLFGSSISIKFSHFFDCHFLRKVVDLRQILFLIYNI